MSSDDIFAQAADHVSSLEAQVARLTKTVEAHESVIRSCIQTIQALGADVQSAVLAHSAEAACHILEEHLKVHKEPVRKDVPLEQLVDIIIEMEADRDAVNDATIDWYLKGFYIGRKSIIDTLRSHRNSCKAAARRFASLTSEQKEKHD